MVADGEDAWAALKGDDAPEIAILDWEMPGLDGAEVCRRVRALGRERYTYLLLLTSRDGRQDMVQGLEAGADDYLIKPFDPAELKARLNTGRRILRLQAELITAREAMRLQATRDSLTGVYNRGAILDTLDRELARGRREGRPVGVVLADIDHFKRINDTHGHQAGDAVLRGFASRVGGVIRPSDLVGRYGGEEFLLVLPGCGEEATLRVCERVRQRTAERPFEDAIAATVSLGAAISAHWGNPADLVRAADTALYRAKAAGRNRSEMLRP